jgi:adenylate cyclase
MRGKALVYGSSLEPIEEAKVTASTNNQEARRLYLRLVWIYVQSSIASVAITAALGYLGLEFTARQWLFLLITIPIAVPLYVILDIYAISVQYRPLRQALAELDAGAQPSHNTLALAIVCALNLPYLSFIRVWFVHGPAATALLALSLGLYNVFYDGQFALWQIITFCATVFCFASPTHAIIEYFVIARQTAPVIDRLEKLCGRLTPDAQKKLVPVGLQKKLLFLSVLVIALPLIFFGASVVFKADLVVANLIRGSGVHYAFWTHMQPLITWVIGVSVVCMGSAISLSILTAGEISRSAAKLIESMNQVELGNLDVSLPVTGTDEYADIFRGFNHMTESLREEVKILEISHNLAGELNLDKLLRSMMHATTELLDADRSTLFLYDPKTDQLWSRVAEGLDTKEIRVPANAGVAGVVFSTGETANIQDPYNNPHFNPQIDKQTGYRTRSILCIPIINKAGERIGVTQVLNKSEGAFTAKDEARLRAFTAQITVALENAKLFEDVIQEKNYNEAILQSTSNGIITLDDCHVILTANHVALSILERAEAAVVGVGAEALFQGPNHWINQRLAKVAETGETDISVAAELHIHTGKTASVNLSVMPLLDVNQARIGSMITIEDITTEKRIKATMARYMSQEVADQLLDTGDTLLRGKSQLVTVLFSDIRNFTTISESLGAIETVTMLNAYFEAMVDVVLKYKGILDKYIGDAIMALFGAPFQGVQDADRAVHVANEMIVALRTLNVSRHATGQVLINIGVGISTGEVVVGSIGSTKRMEYTAIGDTVNLASRLESATKYYHVPVLLSEFTVRDLSEKGKLREIDRIRVQGKMEPVTIFESLEHHTAETFPACDKVVDAYRFGLDAYRRRSWREAIEKFEQALALNPKDHPSHMYIERARHYLEVPPDETWDGVWVMESK